MQLKEVNMPAYICYKPKGSCPTCEHYRYDSERGTKACFAAQDEKKAKRMPSGFIVARLKFKDANIYHCLDRFGKHQFLAEKDMMLGLDRGEYINGTVVGFGESAFIRLSQGVPTLEQNCVYDKMQFSQYAGTFLRAQASLARVNSAKQIAAKSFAAKKPKNKRDAAEQEAAELARAKKLAIATSSNPTGATAGVKRQNFESNPSLWLDGLTEEESADVDSVGED
jgi:hypothetical protein